MSTQEEREAETAALITRAFDPNDEYDGHHGNDRSEESIQTAKDRGDYELAAKIEEKVRTGAKE